MSDLLQASLHWSSLPLTVLLVLVVIYWLLAVFGAVEADSLDLDLDLDADVDADLELEGDAEAPHGGALHSVMQFLYLGDVPVMIPVTCLVVLSWAISVLANHYFNPALSGWLTLALFIPNLMVSFLATRFITTPIARFYQKLEKEQDPQVKIIGSVCEITSPRAGKGLASAIIRTDGAPIQLNVSLEGESELVKGDQALVTRFDKQRRIHIIVPARDGLLENL